jgi:hypothetical protein
MPSDDPAGIALKKLNAVRPKGNPVLMLTDFNTDGIDCLAQHHASDHQAIADALLLKNYVSGWMGGEGYHKAINGNNVGRGGMGDRGNYVNVVDTLKKIRTVPLPAAELSAAATPPLDDASGYKPENGTPSGHPLVTDDPEPDHADTAHQPHDPSGSAPQDLLKSADAAPLKAAHQLPQQKEYLPRTKTQKSAIVGGSMATAAGLAWLFTLLAHKESRDDIKLFWKKLLSPKIKKAVAQKNARMRSQINSHGKESIGALATTLAGIIALAYGVKRKQKQPSTPES